MPRPIRFLFINTNTPINGDVYVRNDRLRTDTRQPVRTTVPTGRSVALYADGRTRAGDVLHIYIKPYRATMFPLGYFIAPGVPGRPMLRNVRVAESSLIKGFRPLSRTLRAPKRRNAFKRRSYNPRLRRSYGFRGLEGTGTGCCCAQELAMSGFGQAEEVAAEVTTKKSPALQNMIATVAVGTIAVGLVWAMGKSTVGRAY